LSTTHHGKEILDTNVVKEYQTRVNKPLIIHDYNHAKGKLNKKQLKFELF